MWYGIYRDGELHDVQRFDDRYPPAAGDFHVTLGSNFDYTIVPVNISPVKSLHNPWYLENYTTIPIEFKQEHQNEPYIPPDECTCHYMESDLRCPWCRQEKQRRREGS